MSCCAFIGRDDRHGQQVLPYDESAMARSVSVAGSLCAGPAFSEASMSKADHREVDLLLDEIRDEMLATGHLTGCAALEQRVFEVLSAVPRHAFVPEELVDCAYANHPLPIGHGQTISQPYIVALMTELIRPKAEDVILEVGTGSGYQAAILAGLVKQVYSLEIIAELAARVEAVFGEFGGAQHGAGLVLRFLPFGSRVGIGDDAGAGLHVQLAVLDDGGADGDRQIHVAVETEVTDGAGVDAALDRFQFVDDLHGPHLGAPETVPAGKVALSTSSAFRPGRSLASTFETMCITCE
jgi:hypothetical protein